MNTEREIQDLAKEFASCQKLLTALGDENRLHLIVSMMQMGKCNGVRVGDITEQSHLSRPAVSHHLQIMKEAGLIAMRKEGTKNYYYFDSNQDSMKRLIHALQKAVDIADALPERQ